MFGFLEAFFSLIAAIINACFPCSKNQNSEKEQPKKRRRYSITQTTTTTTTIEKSGSSPNIAENLK